MPLDRKQSSVFFSVCLSCSMKISAQKLRMFKNRSQKGWIMKLLPNLYLLENLLQSCGNEYFIVEVLVTLNLLIASLSLHRFFCGVFHKLLLFDFTPVFFCGFFIVILLWSPIKLSCLPVELARLNSFFTFIGLLQVFVGLSFVTKAFWRHPRKGNYFLKLFEKQTHFLQNLSELSFWKKLIKT